MITFQYSKNYNYYKAFYGQKITEKLLMSIRSDQKHSPINQRGINKSANQQMYEQSW